MVQVLSQWSADIAEFARRVALTSQVKAAEVRWGVLLWGADFTRFLYFEEEMRQPDPQDYRAEWGVGKARGKPTRNLYIYEKESGKKRFSVTLPRNGAKLQPYFDIPTQEYGAHLFAVPLEDLVPIWVSRETYERLAARGQDHDLILQALLGDLVGNLAPVGPGDNFEEGREA